MDQNQRRAVHQQLTRQQKLAQTGNVRYVNRYGMTPAEIYKAIRKRSDPAEARLVNNRTRSKANRPHAVARQTNRPDKNLLLEVPSVAAQLAARYPSPSWFSCEDKADVSVIIPLYKSASVVKDLIASWDTDDPMKVEVIYVDDSCPLNSKEAVVRLWEKRRTELKRPVGRIYYNLQNQGFGISCNVGAMHATGDYLIFLNADTVVTPGWIRPMVRLLKKEEVGIVGNLQLQHGGAAKDTVDSVGSEWNWDDMNFTHMGKYIYHGQKLRSPFTLDNAPKEIFEVQEREMVTGACIAIRKELHERIGGFNPNYRISYWEDSELCMTVREKGYKIMYQPSSKIYHKIGHSRSGSHKYHQHNINYFRNKWITSGRIDSFVAAPRPEPLKPVTSIVIKRSAAHGDVLVAASLAPALKKKYPGCKVMFTTLCPEIVQGNPHIDRVLTAQELSGRTFDLFYNLDMAYEYRPKSHMLEAYADVVGVRPEDCKLHLSQKAIPGLPEDYAVIHAAAGNWVGRTWPASYFDEISQKLVATGRRVISVGTGRDHIAKGSINFVGRTTIAELAYVIANAKLFIGVDSLPFHVAQTFDIPGVCLFGSIDPKLRLIGDSIHALTADLPCLGCHHRKPAPSTVTNTCEVGGEPCLSGIPVSKVLDAMSSLAH